MAHLTPDPALLCVRDGRWRWPWAVLGTVLTAGLYFALIQVIAALFATLQIDFPDYTTDDGAEQLFVPGQWTTYALIVLTFAPLALAPIFVFRVVHGRRWADWPFRALSSRWSDFLKVAAAFFVVSVVGYGIGYVLFPERFAWQARGLDFWPWFALGALTLLLQTFAEEAAFKGYLMRVWGAVFPFPVFVASVLTVLFIALHWTNDDFARDPAMGVVHFLIGAWISFFLYFRTRGLAAPTGMHWANNMSALLLVATLPSQSPAAALMSYRDPVLTAGGSNLTSIETWLAMLAGNGLFFLLLILPQSPFHVTPAPPAGPPIGEPAPPAVPDIPPVSPDARDAAEQGPMS